MKCPHCKTNVSKIPVNMKCPFCNETLPEPGFWFNFFEGLNEYLVEKGFVFWSIVVLILLLLLGGITKIFGSGLLLGYFGKHFLTAAVTILYAGVIITRYMRVSLRLRLPYGGGDYILKERKVIRNIRTGNHVALIIGFLVCLFWLGPREFLAHFPYYVLIISWFLILSWAIAGLYLDPRMSEDVRFRYYMERLNITRLKLHRKRCVWMIGILFIIAIMYSVILIIPEILTYIVNWWVIGSVIQFFKTYLGWIL